ncbi:MAG: 2-phosphosulfolactate phosphatase [Acidobacteria bacterium]|nr:2-phosphosulfolactate phosphatase [Acidobacteriota bacterium]
MKSSVIIDCFPSSVKKYAGTHTIVAIDVIRATTSAITTVLAGRRCFPVATLADAERMRTDLGNCLLAGEQHGDVPDGFDLNNSPVELARIDGDLRPVVLLSTSGTQLMCFGAAAGPAYVACFRNYRAISEALAGHHAKVAVIGAGSRNEFREEDQMCCAWIAEALLDSGYKAENRSTLDIVKRWSGAPPEACVTGNSAKYLQRSGQIHDLEFVLTHVNDVDSAFVMSEGEVVPELVPAALVTASIEPFEVAA